MSEVLTRIQKLGIIPVVKIDDEKNAVSLAKSLCEGGLPVAEVTFHTQAAEEAIRNITQALPDMLIGAGTILTTDQVDRAIAAGCKFITCNGLNPELVKYCQSKNILITPGVSSPTEIEQAIELGLEAVKFFPAEQLGGITKIEAISTSYAGIKFIPSGGINTDNLTSYLDVDGILACSGSWMVKSELINNGQFDEIKRLTQEAVHTMLGFELKHVGINATNEEEADKTASFFERLFGLTKKVGNSSIFAGSAVEVMKQPFKGKNGHIAIQSNYVDRAVYHLETLGCEYDWDTAKYNKKGKLTVIYLKGESGGFAVHLVQK